MTTYTRNCLLALASDYATSPLQKLVIELFVAAINPAGLTSSSKWLLLQITNSSEASSAKTNHYTEKISGSDRGGMVSRVWLFTVRTDDRRGEVKSLP